MLAWAPVSRMCMPVPRSSRALAARSWPGVLLLLAFAGCNALVGNEKRQGAKPGSESDEGSATGPVAGSSGKGGGSANSGPGRGQAGRPGETAGGSGADPAAGATPSVAGSDSSRASGTGGSGSVPVNPPAPVVCDPACSGKTPICQDGICVALQVTGGVVGSGGELQSSSGAVRLVEHGFEYGPRVCGTANGKPVCVTGSIGP